MKYVWWSQDRFAKIKAEKVRDVLGTQAEEEEGMVKRY